MRKAIGTLAGRGDQRFLNEVSGSQDLFISHNPSVPSPSLGTSIRITFRPIRSRPGRNLVAASLRSARRASFLADSTHCDNILTHKTRAALHKC